MFIDFHDGRLVSAAVAIVWRTKERHDVLVMRPSEAIHDKLMRAAHQHASLAKLVASGSA